MKIKSDKPTESERFDDVMDRILSVPHEQVQRALNKEKEEKAQRKQKKVNKNDSRGN